MNRNEIIIFETEDHQVKLPVTVEGETVWLNRNQMSELFDRDIKTIGKHINNALKEELSVDNSTVAKFATVQIEGEREVERNIEYYSLDVIISVGYRVKSKRGVEFRRWANLMMLFLETAMFAQFGADTSSEIKRLMIILVGAGISVAVVTMAIYMIVQTTREIKQYVHACAS